MRAVSGCYRAKRQIGATSTHNLLTGSSTGSVGSSRNGLNWMLHARKEHGEFHAGESAWSPTTEREVQTQQRRAHEKETGRPSFFACSVAARIFL